MEYYVYRETAFIESVDSLTPLKTVVGDSYTTDTLPSTRVYFYVVVASDGIKTSATSNNIYVEYKLPTLNEFIITFGIVGGAAVVVITLINLRKKNFKTV